MESISDTGAIVLNSDTPVKPSTKDMLIKEQKRQMRMQLLQKQRKKIIKKLKTLQQREINFDKEDEEERLIEDELRLQKALKDIEKSLYCRGELDGAGDDYKILFDKDGVEKIVITGTGNELLDQRLTEVMQNSFYVGRRFDIASLSINTIGKICQEVRSEQIEKNGTSSIPMRRSAAWDSMRKAVASRLKQLIVEYRYKNHEKNLNAFLTVEEEEQLDSIVAERQPVDLQTACEILDKEAPSDLQSLEKDVSETINSAENRTETSSSCTSANPECSIIEEVLSVENTINNIVESNAQEQGNINSFNFDCSEKNPSPEAPVTPPTGAHNDSQPCVPGVKEQEVENEEKDQTEADETDGEDLLKPKWLVGVNSNELANCYNKHIEDEDEIKIIFTTEGAEYEFYPPNIDPNKMARVSQWVMTVNPENVVEGNDGVSSDEFSEFCLSQSLIDTLDNLQSKVEYNSPNKKSEKRRLDNYDRRERASKLHCKGLQPPMSITDEIEIITID